LRDLDHQVSSINFSNGKKRPVDGRSGPFWLTCIVPSRLALEIKQQEELEKKKDASDNGLHPG
jgi:hypothetical protein